MSQPGVENGSSVQNGDLRGEPRATHRLWARALCVLVPALLVLACFAGAAAEAPAGERFITLASTTSTEGSGLLEDILPRFQAKTGIEVRVVAVGTGQALRISRRGDADVLLVHDRASEDRFVSEGWGLERFDVMYNDFVIVGPKDADPAAVRGTRDAAAALAAIAGKRARFASRGDDSGTHKAEMRLWKAAGVDPSGASGQWYLETGSGMGKTLNVASGLGAYTLSDRATWLSFRNRASLSIAVEGDPRLANPYGVIQVSPERHPHVKAEYAQAFVRWLISPEGQQAIGGYMPDGVVLFHPGAPPDLP